MAMDTIYRIKPVVGHQVRHGRGVTDFSSVRLKNEIDKRIALIVFKAVGDISLPSTSHQLFLICTCLRNINVIYNYRVHKNG